VIVELQEKLLAPKRELESREGTVIAWEERLTSFTHALREGSIECDTSHARAATTLRDYSAQVSASSSQSECLKAFSQRLVECMALLGLQETDPEVSKAILAEELEHGVHPPDGQDQLARLDKVRAHVDQITEDHVIEGEQLS
jgi:hypothetical protein